MEANKFAYGAKSIVLPSGVELTYCELGEENEEVVLSGAFYFHTFMPVLEGLAKKYHVYGIVMRFDGKGTRFNEDGSIHWGLQWGEDIYEFAKAMNVRKFHYVGKCHGTVPGWFMLKEHPDMIESFCSFYMVPHLCGQSANQWFDTMKNEGPQALIAKALRKQESIPVKIREMQTLGPSAASTPAVEMYAAAPEKMWASLEECRALMETVETPICLMFGTEDIIFHDYYESNLEAIRILKNSRTVILQGERHLMEIDCPERVVNEALFFIEDSKNKY